jgi:hypothetical protein
MSLSLNNLINELVELQENLGNTGYDGDPDVSLAIQPHYPFEHRIARVVAHCSRCGYSADDCGCADDGLEPDIKVYIAEGGQVGYLSGSAAEVAWSG